MSRNAALKFTGACSERARPSSSLVASELGDHATFYYPVARPREDESAHAIRLLVCHVSHRGAAV